MPKPCLSGRTVTAKESTSALKFVRPLGRATRESKSNELGSAIQREREANAQSYDHNYLC
jgi:hypothetical protein